MSASDDTALSPQILKEARRREERQRWRETRVMWAFIAPAVFMVSLFLLVPVLIDVVLSFTRWQRFSGLDQFAGLANYQRLFAIPYFGQAMTNTVIWVLASISLPLVIGLALALLFRGIPFQETIKSIWFLPKVLAPTAIGAIWVYMFAPRGVINSVVSSVTGQDFDFGWLFSPMTVTPSVILVSVWSSVGISMVLLLLGLSAIPKDPIEAARVDGASSWQIFLYVVLPLLLPTIIVVTILNVVAGFTTFDLLWVMASSFPGKRTLSLAVYMYYESFSNASWAYGAAIAVVLGAMVLVISAMLAVLQSYVEKRIR